MASPFVIQCSPTLQMIRLWNFTLFEITKHDLEIHNMDHKLILTEILDIKNI
jgi:hypothetical protein